MLGVHQVISFSVSMADEADHRPNVLLVVANSLGWQDLPRHGGEGEAPTLEKLADEGMEVLRFYSCPALATSRASLLTGRYHYRAGVAGDTHGENVMHGYEITLGEVFRDNGYETGFFGEWKNGRNWPSNAQGQGFERVAGCDDESVVEFIQRDWKRPFFAWLSLPVKAGINSVDRELSRVLHVLDEAGRRDNTVVVFTSDTAAGSPTIKSGSAPAIPRFFGDAESVHEGGVRVPFLVRWPGHVPAGKQTREISAGIDLLPTLVDLCGLTFVETLELDGISLAELLHTGGEPRRWPNRLLFTSFTPPGFKIKQAAVSVRTGRWLAVKEPRSSRAENAEDKEKWELYDKHADPYQRYNVAGEYWSLAGHMSADFAFWMKRTTENGLSPVAQDIGHREWPEVTLHREDAMFDQETTGKEWRWSVDIVADSAVKCQVGITGKIDTLLVVRGEQIESIHPTDAGEPWMMSLDRRVTEIRVKAEAASFEELRLEILDP